MAYDFFCLTSESNFTLSPKALSNELCKKLIIIVIFFIVQKFSKTPSKFCSCRFYRPVEIVYDGVRSIGQSCLIAAANFCWTCCCRESVQSQSGSRLLGLYMENALFLIRWVVSRHFAPKRKCRDILWCVVPESCAAGWR